MARPPRNRTVLVALAIAVVVIAVVGQRLLAGHAFTKLEADTVEGDAHRVAVALTYEQRLLQNYGSTNAIWDNSYTDVTTADRDAFAADFPPSQLQDLYGVDGVAGIDRTGRVTTGGLVDGDHFQPLPADLTSARLATTVAFDADAGTARCGAVVTSVAPYLYCGFPVRNSNSAGTPGFGLVFLHALDATALHALATSTDLALTVAPRAAVPSDHPLTIATGLGPMTAATRNESGDSVQLTMAVPALGGRHLVLQSLHPRPIHAAASRSGNETLLLLGACALVLGGLVLLLTRRAVRDRVEPLRTTTEKILASGDAQLRLDATGGGELAALAATINSLLDDLARQADEVRRAQADRERELEAAHDEARRDEETVRAQAQQQVAATVETVLAELASVLDQADLVRVASAEIASRTGETDAITAEVLTEAAAANEALGELEERLGHVHDVVGAITAITDQTRMLALNATIEAARAGDFGAGFRVVANEVSALAGDTATSASDISATTGRVAGTAGRVVTTIGGVTSRVAAVSDATSQVREVATRQAETVDELTGVVRRTVDRVRALSN